MSLETALTTATKRMIDLSTSHISHEDFRLFGAVRGLTPRTVPHEYGLVVFVASDSRYVQDAVDCMRGVGISKEFIAIYKAAADLGDDVMIINFDRDGDVIDGLPTFNW